MKGWLVIVLRRHAEALHDLTHEEFMELGPIVEATIRTLSAYFDCEKEYLAQYAEGTGFHHVHIHVVAKPVDLPDELKGPQIFKLLAVDQAAAAPRGEIRELCMELHDRCRLTPA
jgi:diadenosine tetraphosphate (Ap4A) HIT family hydrolase